MQALRFAGVVMASVLFLGLRLDSAVAQEPSPDATIRLHQRMLQRNAYDARAYYRLSDAYIQKARETGDVTYFNLAEEALRKALTIAPDYAAATRHLAYVLYSRHAFEDAAAQARKAIELSPTDSHAHGILGDAYLEVGEYAEADQAYQRMARLDGGLSAYSRLSALKALRGDVAGAIADLERAVDAGKTSGQPRESIAWAQWQLGNEHFARGETKGAEAQYLAALATYPNYHRAWAGLAQIHAAERQYAQAVELYQKAIAIIPQPDYVAALGDVYAKTGRFEEAKKQYDLVEYIGRLNALNQVLYNRELAYFYADHDLKLEEALVLATRELGARRDIYAYDLLAWALYKNGKAEEARAAMAEALKLGTRDARLFFHAGMIERRLGHAGAAQEYLRRALQTNPHFHIVHADEAARVLQDLGAQPVRISSERARDGQ